MSACLYKMKYVYNKKQLKLSAVRVRREAEYEDNRQKPGNHPAADGT